MNIGWMKTHKHINTHRQTHLHTHTHTHTYIWNTYTLYLQDTHIHTHNAKETLQFTQIYILKIIIVTEMW